MYRIWYSTEVIADYIIDNTELSKYPHIKEKLLESDAKNPTGFHRIPDHIKKILYLDAPDLIVEYNSEPVFTIEISQEAGTGHNVFQRFSRIAASAENSVPAIYIYPEASIVQREDRKSGGFYYTWDEINPLLFKALQRLTDLYDIPVLLYYYPNKKGAIPNPVYSDYTKGKGLKRTTNVMHSGMPDEKDDEMIKLFCFINEIINNINTGSLAKTKENLLKSKLYYERREWMYQQYFAKKGTKKDDDMAPLTAAETLQTSYLLNYLKKNENKKYSLGDYLNKREYTIFYQVDATFRGDPYPGALAAIDYIKCRNGKSFEEREYNLVLVWGRLTNINQVDKTFTITSSKKASIKDFVNGVKKCAKHNLLQKDYSMLKNYEIPRYFMQTRYGSMYSKVKHIRVYSYFSDVILFEDGELWRDA